MNVFKLSLNVPYHILFQTKKIKKIGHRARKRNMGQSYGIYAFNGTSHVRFSLQFTVAESKAYCSNT